MKIGVSLPDDLVTFADEEAQRRDTSRSGLLAQLLRSERIRQQTQQYLDRHGWDVADDEQGWREYQRSKMAEEYSEDEWWPHNPAYTPGRRSLKKLRRPRTSAT